MAIDVSHKAVLLTHHNSVSQVVETLEQYFNMNTDGWTAQNKQDITDYLDAMKEDLKFLYNVLSER